MPHLQQNEDQRRAWMIRLLRRSPVLRCGIYLGGAAAALQTIVRVYGPAVHYSIPAIHLRTMPFVAGWTWAFITLRNEDRMRWLHIPDRQRVAQAVLGGALGAGAFLAIAGTAAAFGWVQVPTWGWQQTPKLDVARALLYLAAGHAAVAWNEEVVFRGYGLDAATAAFGRPVAITGLVTLFALTHGPGLQVFVGQSALGLALTFLRLRSDSLWLPVSYHFAWNYLQTAVLGPPDALPSLRPMQVQGPELWIGRPGYPVPGLFMMIVNLIVAVSAGLPWWRQTRTARNVNRQR